jgi:mono/diheme cytochrome c family protein
LAFARETVSPVFPGSLDADLVKLGADLFHGRVKPANRRGFVSCKTCHGTYTKKDPAGDWSAPGSWLVDYNHSDKFRNVKTDPTYNEVLQSFRPIVEHLSKLAAYYEAEGRPDLTPTASVPDKPGYVAPPLVGVWASAPYFHNGSVPTINAVLNSKERPEIWLRNCSDPHAYDLELVGLEHSTLTREELEASAAKAAEANPKSKAWIDHRSTYDTKGFGHANTGHTFGDNLSDQERSAVIEFLKSLSGPDMPPAKAHPRPQSLVESK